MKKSELVRYIIVIILISVALAGCSRKEGDGIKDQGGISFTVTREEKQKRPISTLYFYDFYLKSVKKIYSIPYESQYPLMVYNKNKSRVYYTKTPADNHGDEIFVYDLKKKATKQITNQFFAINEVIPTNNNLFIAAVHRGDHIAVQPFFFDQTKFNVKNYSFDEDFTLQRAKGTSYNKNIYMSGYSEHESNLRAEDKKDGVDNTMYVLKKNKLFKIFKTHKQYIESFAVNKEGILYKQADRLFDPDKKRELRFYEFSAGKSKKVSIDNKLLRDMSDIVYFSNKDELFFIRVCDNGTYELCKKKLTKNNYQVLYRTQGKEAINNGQFVQ